jgi:hypothetical protein
MEAPTPIAEKNFSIEINNNKTELKLSSSENILSLSTELNNKKYRLTISSEELQQSQRFFKQFSSFDEILKALSKILTTSKNIIFKDNSIEIKYKNFFDEDISIKIPEEKNINLLFLNLKKLQIENDNLKQMLLKNNKNNFEIYKNLFNSIKNSDILKEDEEQMIKNWINSNKKISFELIYKATRDGDDVKDFHKLCDEIAPTLTLGKTKNGNRFGGYTSVALTKNSSDNAINDPNAFVFSIDKKYKYNTNNPSYAVRSNSSRGPCFGSNCPFYIGNKFLTQNTSYSNPSNDYNSPPYVLTGAQYFTLEELEVYKVKFE